MLNTIVPLNRHDTSTRLTFSFDTSQMQNLFLFFEMVDKNFESINNSRVFLAAIKFSQKQKREKDMAFEKKTVFF